MVKGQRQAIVQTLTLLQGNLTLIQKQRPVEAVSPARRAHLCGGRLGRGLKFLNGGGLEA